MPPEVLPPLVASDLTVAHHAADKGWLRNFIDDVLDPESDLLYRQSKRPDVWHRIRWRIPTIRSTWELLRDPLIAADWEFQPVRDDTARAERRAREITEQCAGSAGWGDAKAGAAEQVFRGKVAMELGGRIGGFGDVEKGEDLLPRVTIVPSFAFTHMLETGEERLLLRDSDPRYGVPMRQPKWKWKWATGIYGSTEGGNWNGAGLGLALFWLYVMGTAGDKWWAKAQERFGAPLPIATVEGANYVEIRTRLKEMFASMAAHDDGWIVPPGAKLEFMNAAPRAWPNFEAWDDRIERKVRLCVFGVSDLQQLGPNGSFSAIRMQASQVTGRHWQVSQAMAGPLGQIGMNAADYLFGERMRLVAVPKFEDPANPQDRREGLKLGAELGLEVPVDYPYEVCGIPKPDTVQGPTIKLALAPAGGGMALPGGGAGLGARSFPFDRRPLPPMRQAQPVPPAPAKGKDGAAPPVGETGNVAAGEATADPQATLNGAQIASLLEIIAAVSEGRLTKDTAVQVIVAGYPFDEQRAGEIMQDVTEGRSVTAQSLQQRAQPERRKVDYAEVSATNRVKDLAADEHAAQAALLSEAHSVTDAIGRQLMTPIRAKLVQAAKPLLGKAAAGDEPASQPTR